MSQPLSSPRLLLRPLAATDAALYCRLYGDPEAMAWIGTPQSVDAAARSFQTAFALGQASPPRRLFWVMHEKISGLDLGLIGLTLDEPAGGEVGVLLPVMFQGQGYASEAIAALADHAFEHLALARLHTRHLPGHALAAGLMASLGFERTANDDITLDWGWQLSATRWAGLSGRQGPADRLT